MLSLFLVWSSGFCNPCHLFFWETVMIETSLWSGTVHLQRGFLFLYSELQVSFGEHSAYKLPSSSVLRAMPCACVFWSPVFCKIVGTKDWERAQEPLALNRDQMHLDDQQMSECPWRSFRPLRTDSTIFIGLFFCFPVWKIRIRSLHIQLSRFLHIIPPVQSRIIDPCPLY